MDMGAQDVALDLIANGDKNGAKEAWREFLGHPEWGPIASHNLAILHMYESFEDSMELEKYGLSATDFLSSDICVGRIKARLRTLDDPRLPRNSAEAIKEQLRDSMPPIRCVSALSASGTKTTSGGTGTSDAPGTSPVEKKHSEASSATSWKTISDALRPNAR
jgi:hypothetical protein